MDSEASDNRSWPTHERGGGILDLQVPVNWIRGGAPDDQFGLLNGLILSNPDVDGGVLSALGGCEVVGAWCAVGDGWLSGGCRGWRRYILAAACARGGNDVCPYPLPGTSGNGGRETTRPQVLAQP